MNPLLHLTLSPTLYQSPMLSYLNGSITVCSLMIGLFFFKYYRKTRDRLLVYFGVAFWMLGAERFLLTLVPQENESRSLIFLLRLSAFLLIIIGILGKNRERR